MIPCEVNVKKTGTQRMNVLIVEDSQQIMETLTDYLEMEGMTVDCAYHGQAALQLIQQSSYDVIIMDIMMPKLDGIAAVQQIRQQYLCQTPILFLTAKDTIQDKTAAFEAGGDDYLVKPFAMKELLLRLEALSKRGFRQDLTRLTLADIVFDAVTGKVTRGDEPLKLSRIQLKILKLLMQKSPALVSKQYLLDEIWGDDEPPSDALRSHIYALRTAIDSGRDEPLLETVHGQGYRLVS